MTASSTMAVMSAAVIGAIAGSDIDRYLALTAALALTVGVLLLNVVSRVSLAALKRGQG